MTIYDAEVDADLVAAVEGGMDMTHALIEQLRREVNQVKSALAEVEKKRSAESHALRLKPKAKV